MKKCVVCPNEVADDGPPCCQGCIDHFDALAEGREPPKDLTLGIVDLDDEDLPF